MTTDSNLEWRDIPGFEGRYQVSNTGEVRGVERQVTSGGLPYTVKGRVLKASPDKTTGYRRVSLGRKLYYVHRIVCEVFNGGPEGEGLEVRHLDGNKLNNRPDNLKWGTSKENTRDMILQGNHPNQRKTHCKRGHEFTAENTYTSRTGWRSCRACWKVHSAVQSARRKEKGEHLERG